MRQWMKDLREKNHLTQQDLAERLHTTRTNVSMIELGERQQNITLKLLGQLADIFGVPVQQLIDAENRKSED